VRTTEKEMQEIDIQNWERKTAYDFFKDCEDPFFGITSKVNVTNAYSKAKELGESFHLVYLHAAMKAINSIEAFKYRIKDSKIYIPKTIHVSCTVARDDHSFGIANFPFNEDFNVFKLDARIVLDRVAKENSIQGDYSIVDVIHISALPWFNFTHVRNPRFKTNQDSIPKLVFGKFEETANGKEMPVNIDAHHGFADAYHVGVFFQLFQENLDKF